MVTSLAMGAGLKRLPKSSTSEVAAVRRLPESKTSEVLSIILLFAEFHAHVYAGLARTVFDVDIRDAEAIDQLNELIELSPRRLRIKRLAQDELRQQEVL